MKAIQGTSGCTAASEDAYHNSLIQIYATEHKVKITSHRFF